MYVSLCEEFQIIFKRKGVIKCWCVCMLLNFKLTVCTDFWSKTALAQIFVCHKQYFCPLRKIEVKSLVGWVGVTCNIYTIRASDISHPSFAQNCI